MPLTPEEMAFLGPTVAEYSEIRLGPAWTVLYKLDVLGSEVTWLMEAYHIVDPIRLVTVATPDGGTKEILEFGRSPEQLPECPWPDAETVRRRNVELELEVEAYRAANPLLVGDSPDRRNRSSLSSAEGRTRTARA